MTEESGTDRKGSAREPEPQRDKAPWNPPRLVAHGTITVRTLGKSGGAPPP